MNKTKISRAVITPTYSGHFKFIKNYLNSFNEFLEDRDFPICFIIEKSEADEFEKIISRYKDKLNIRVCFLEDVFQKYGVKKTPAEILRKYGRLSFQTLKKFCGALYLEYDQFLLLDSESLLIKDTDMNKLFDDYFANPNFIATKVSERFEGYRDCFTFNYIDTVSKILGNSPEYWLVESYNWFYELRILKDLVDDYGNPFEIVKKAVLTNKFPDLEGVLECLLYYQYIVNNNHKYKYDIIVLNDVLPTYLGNEYKNFIKTFNSSKMNVCGLFEQFSRLLNSDNVEGFIKFINDYNLRVLRIENADGNYMLQKKLIENCDVRILASCQDNCFDYNIITNKDNIENCIVTPTYKGHFKYIHNYLKSFNKYALDKDNFCIYFVINASEYLPLKDIILKYNEILNIKILFFDNILENFNVNMSPDDLLNKYGRFSFQTLKKFYTMLYIGDNHRYLVVDSESMLVNETNMQDLFDRYFERPFIAYSVISCRTKSDNFFAEEVSNVDYVLKCGTDKWFLENFVWFYDYKILNNLCEDFGSPIELVDKVYAKQLTLPDTSNCGLFEICLYCNYVYMHNSIYNYNIINVDEQLCKYLPSRVIDKFKKDFFRLCNGGSGLLEHVMLCLTKSNVLLLAKMIKQMGFNIIRCDRTDAGNYKLQKQFMDIVQPSILAASQNHCFGLNATFKNRFRLLVTESKSFMKLQKHGRKFIVPFVFLWKFSWRMAEWAYEILLVLFYSVRFCISFVRNLKTIVRG